MDLTNREGDKEWVDLNGNQDNYLRENGMEDKKRVTVYGNPQKAVDIRENGDTTNKTEREYTTMLVDQHIQAISKIS